MRSLILFRRAFLVSFALIALISSLLLYHFFIILPSDFAHFKQLKAMKNEISQAHAPTEQISRNVQKDIWLAQDGKRLHHRINSEKSLITFLPKGHHHEVVEKMENIHGTMQEKVNQAEETVRHFKALSGFYHYGNNEFFANEVELKLINQSLPKPETEKLLLSGTAEAMTLHLSDHRPKISVLKLKAILP
jgi:hypothetical protein